MVFVQGGAAWIDSLYIRTHRQPEADGTFETQREIMSFSSTQFWMSNVTFQADGNSDAYCWTCGFVAAKEASVYAEGVTFLAVFATCPPGEHRNEMQGCLAR